MENVFEIIKYTLPSIIVFLTAYFMLKTILDNEAKRKNAELKMNNQNIITPIRLQAYERMTLVLERISPEALVMRLQNSQMTSKELQSKMLSSIRAEFDHNLSQQVYISNSAWEVIRNTRENVVKIINSAADKVSPEVPAIVLSKTIIESLMEMEQKPTAIALEFLKAEAQQFM